MNVGCVTDALNKCEASVKKAAENSCEKCGAEKVKGYFQSYCPRCDRFWFDQCVVCKQKRMFCSC